MVFWTKVEILWMFFSLEGIRIGKDIINKGEVWRVENGRKIRFWVDNWVEGSPLYRQATVDLGQDWSNTKAEDFMLPHG